MSPVAHFRGGPLDGQVRAMEELPPTFRVPESPPVDLVSADDLVLLRHHIYERARGVVANEAVYEWKGLA